MAGVAARVLVERYELQERIGRGAMGEVWAATDLQTGEAVAVKLSQGWAAAEPELVARFEREAKILRRIKSPFVCSLVEAGRDPENVPYMVLERLQGEGFSWVAFEHLVVDLLRAMGYGGADEASV